MSVTLNEAQTDKSTTLPPQHQTIQPGLETLMNPPPQSEMQDYVGSGRLQGQVALITGGDSGIGRAVAVAYAKEGADIVVVYLDEEEDAQRTRELIEATGQRCLLLAGDIGDEQFCADAVEQTIDRFERLDILVNNAAEQHPQDSIGDISAEQLEKTFRTNLFSMFYLVKAALPYLKGGGRIINTASITAYRGSPKLLDYSASKGAIVAFTRSLAKALIKEDIRVNAVAPGPVWTPLIPSTFDAEKVSHFGDDVPMKRPGQPDEIAPAFVFLASRDSSYIAGQVIHPNGGEVVNG
ncbi:SDR family oxidoreductase [Chitinimonas lacunae]|uniref:SDR family oxidoreductase n=1 Tax=Chitinimonas lacunae TaxID=1963018 RepID=A0ABV8MNC6_9NEIS